MPFISNFCKGNLRCKYSFLSNFHLFICLFWTYGFLFYLMDYFPSLLLFISFFKCPRWVHGNPMKLIGKTPNPYAMSPFPLSVTHSLCSWYVLPLSACCLRELCHHWKFLLISIPQNMGKLMQLSTEYQSIHTFGSYQCLFQPIVIGYTLNYFKKVKIS